MLSLQARKITASFLLLVFLTSTFTAVIPLNQPAHAAIPALRRTFDTQDSHTGPVVHSSGIYPAYCLDYGVPGPRNTEYTRGEKFSKGTGHLGRAISIAMDLGPSALTGGTTINGISLSNLEWRMATQVAIHRLQGENLPYSTSSDYWRASTWIVNRALNENTVQLNRYWRYEPPADVRMQRMTLPLGDPLTARVRVQKRSAHGGTVLANATFGMWTNRSAAVSGNTASSSFIGQSRSDSEGNAWWYRIPVGTTYYIKELIPPAGYTLNPTILEAHPTFGDDSEIARDSLPIYTAGTITNEVIAIGRIELTKQSVSAGNIVSAGSVQSNSAYSLAGARYGIWTSKAAADAKNTGASSYIGQMITNARGEAHFDGLSMGSYYVRELQPPAGHVLDATTHSITLTSTGTTTPTIGRIISSDARRYGTRLAIQKTDKETGLAIASGGASLRNAEFEIRWADPSKTGGWEVQKLVTDAEGRAEYLAGTGSGANFRPGIPIGEFQIRETKPPKGYLLNPEFSSWRTYKVEDSTSVDRPIEISLHNLIPRIAEPLIRGDIAINKYGNSLESQVDVMTALEGIRFDIIDNMRTNGDGKTNSRYGKIVGTLVTDRDGYASSRDLIPPKAQWASKDYSSGFLEYGDYLLREDIASTPDGLRPIEDMRFSISENGVERRYGLFNHEITAALSIVKRDAETQKVIPIAGTQFQLFDKDMNLMSFTINYPHSTEISTFTTDESGQINIPDPLKRGSYFLKEVQAPEGYLLLEDPITFTIEDHYNWSEPLIICIDNYPAKGRVRIHKSDSVTNEAVPDTTFELRAKSDIVTKDGSVRLQAGELADILRTDEEGTSESIDLYLGDYELREIEANHGYLLNDKVFDIQLRYADQNTALVYYDIEIENEPVTVSCEVRKSTIDITSAGFKSLPDEGNIDNSAQGSKELYRYDVNFRSTSNDWADEYVVIDYLEGVNADQIRIEELWTPVVWGDSNGRYNLWYQTNLSDETTLYSDSFAASKDEYNPANPEKFMRFDNKGWKLWLEDAGTTERQRLKVSELGLGTSEYITSLKLEFGRVRKGFTSKNSEDWLVKKDEHFYSDDLLRAKGLAPLSYLVYCPHPLEKFDPLTGDENTIVNSASSHTTRNINLIDDDKDEVQTRLVDSFTSENDSELLEDEHSKSEISDNEDDTSQEEQTEQEEKSSPSPSPSPKPNDGPQTGDLGNTGQWLLLALAAALTATLAACGILIKTKTDKKKDTGADSHD